MARYIDADEAIRLYAHYEKWHSYDAFDLEPILNDMPTADVVEVVRCRECRWGREVCGNIECSVDLNAPTEYHGYNWFCPNGEKMDEVEHDE